MEAEADLVSARPDEEVGMDDGDIHGDAEGIAIDGVADLDRLGGVRGERQEGRHGQQQESAHVSFIGQRAARAT